MRNRISLVIICLILGASFIPICESISIKKENIKIAPVKENSNLWGSVSININGINSSASATCYLSNIAWSGRYDFSYEIVFYGMDNYRFKGEYSIYSSLGDIFFFDRTKSFDFCNNSIPENDIDRQTRVITDGLRLAEILCILNGEIYKWEDGKWIFVEMFGCSDNHSSSVMFPKKYSDNIKDNLINNYNSYYFFENTINTCNDNHPPNPPVIKGPSSGRAKSKQVYTIMVTDYDADDIYYYIGWGDSTFDGWIGPIGAGTDSTISHIWNRKGDYTIRAIAKDEHGAQSNWSTFDVSMPKNKATYNSLFLQKFFQRFPFLNKILDQIIL